MGKPVLSRYRVDDVPVFLRPVMVAYGYGLGALLLVSLVALRLSIRVRIAGREHLKPNTNHIFCLWHRFVPLALISATPSIPSILDGLPQAWMQHPACYMKPMHVLLRLMGVRRLVMGSTGHSGREAADELIGHLRGGYSTVLNPDGPQGPAFTLKKGILHMSLQSHVPIVAMRFKVSKAMALRTWDRKKVAYPFSTIEVTFGKPIQVTSDNFEYASELVAQALG